MFGARLKNSGELISDAISCSCVAPACRAPIQKPTSDPLGARPSSVLYSDVTKLPRYSGLVSRISMAVSRVGA